jgi:hypothetical protein
MDFGAGVVGIFKGTGILYHPTILAIKPITKIPKADKSNPLPKIANAVLIVSPHTSLKVFG